MNIAHLGIKGLPARGGAERIVEALARRLKNRHAITIYCSARYTPADYKSADVRLIRVPCGSGKFTQMTSLNIVAAFHSVLRGNYDLIHLHNIEASFVLPILKTRFKTLTTAHGRMTPGNRWGRAATMLLQAMEYPFARWSDAASSVSELHAQELGAQFHRPVRYIPNGIDVAPEIDGIGARAILDAHRLPPRDYALFVSGRLIPLKGAHLLVEAFRQVVGDHRLVFVGDISDSSGYTISLRARADARTTFVPFVESSPALLGLMQASRLVVLPSLVEAMSMTLLEAASVGAPIVCSDIPANTAVLPDRALFFRSGDVNDLAEKLRWALNHPDAMRALGLRAQTYVREHFNWDTIAEQYESLYNEIVKR
ncbi:MAG: glycosyltransferase family 4 protein [Chloroflexi bacterium]|nr:glycosyltransferase family 4 protein [Chloroflexota bacterium]